MTGAASSSRRLILLAVVAGLVFAWYSAHSLLMLFAGILFAVFLDACTRGLGYILPLSRPWRFGLVGRCSASLAALAVAWGIIRLPAQARMLMQVMDSQLDCARELSGQLRYRPVRTGRPA